MGVTTIEHFMNCSRESSPGKPVKKKLGPLCETSAGIRGSVMPLCGGSWRRRNLLAAGPILKLQSIHTYLGTYAMQGPAQTLLAVLWTFPDVVCPPINTPLPNSSFCTAPLARVYIIPCWALRLLNGARCVISSLQLFDLFTYCTRPHTLPCSCFILASVKLCPNRTRRRAINHGPISGSNGPSSLRTRASADQKQHRS